MNRNLYLKIADTINKYEMFPETDAKVIVGVSGGADSMALLHFLINYLSRERIIVCHINHSIRGFEADRDEMFVETFCKANSVTFESAAFDIPSIAKEKGIGIEECGREKRYEFFSSFVNNKDDRIATAHTLSDSTETMVFKFITGTSIKGLCGISPVRENIVRPLIMLTRKEIEQYCKDNDISFVTDSSNLSDDYTRNFIRHQIIPKMKEINPSLEKRMLSLSQSASEDEAYLSEIARDIIKKSKTENGYKADFFINTARPCAIRALKIVLDNEGAKRPSFVQLSSCLDIIKSGGSVSLSGNVSLVCEFGIFNVFENKGGELEDFSYSVEFSKPIFVPNGEILVEKTDKNENFLKKHKKINNLLLTDAFDCGIISNSLCIRSRRAGDLFMQKGRGVTKTLKKLFSEAKVPRSMRNRLCVLEDNGNIIWVEKFGVSEHYKITEKTEKVAVITLKQGE